MNLEAERAVLGSLLIDTRCEVDLEPSDFFVVHHQHIFEAIQRLGDTPRDLVTVVGQLERDGTLRDIGGAPFLLSLTDSVPTSLNAGHYASIVKAASQLKHLENECLDVARACQSGLPLQELLERLRGEVLSLSNQTVEGDPVSLLNVLPEVYESMKQEAVPTIGSGLFDLDRLTGGLGRGELILLAARPGVGKTAMALSIARHAATASPVLVVSCEMSSKSLALRLISAEAEVDSHMLKAGVIPEVALQRVEKACERLSKLPIWIDDTSSLTVEQIATIARRMVQTNGIGLIIVDYIQLLGGKGRDELAIVTEISKGLKRLARELDIPILALSQLSRKPEERTGGRPILSDLRSSGSLEQDADVVMLLYREALQNPECDNPTVAELMVAKNRNGPTGKIELVYLASWTRFESLSKEVTL